MPPIIASHDRLYTNRVAFNRAIDEGDPLEAAEFALELLLAHTMQAFSPSAAVTVAGEGGCVELSVRDRNGAYGPGNYRVRALAARLGEDVITSLPYGRFAVT